MMVTFEISYFTFTKGGSDEIEKSQRRSAQERDALL